MNILFLFVSLPQLDSGNSIFASLIKQFKDNGHNVFVAAKAKNSHETTIGVEYGINVLRIGSNEFTGVSNNIKKALAYQEYTFKLRYLTYKYFKDNKIGLIISHSLPPELPFAVNYLKRKFDCKFMLIQSDYIWQDAVAFGYFSKSSIIARYYRLWEKKMFNIANYILCPTKGNIEFIINEYPDISRSVCHFVPFWQKPAGYLTNRFKPKEYEDKFVVVYGGSIGAAQRIERFVDLAESVKDIDKIQFVLLWRGAYVDVIKGLINTKHLTNIEIKPFIPQEEYLSFLSSCDVGMVILNEKMATPNFPSKALSYLDMKVPILAALDYSTDFGKYLEENNAGLWAHSDDIEGLRIQLMKYYDSPNLRKQNADNGKLLFDSEMTPEKAYEKIMSIVTDK